MGAELQRQQEQLKNLNCKLKSLTELSHGEGATEIVQKLYEG